jgi:hypothetical protein
VKDLFASPLSLAASILSSSVTLAGSRLRLPSSGDGAEDGGVDVDAEDDEEESFVSLEYISSIKDLLGTLWLAG